MSLKWIKKRNVQSESIAHFTGALETTRERDPISSEVLVTPEALITPEL